jgi:uncharacterized membrane protein
MNAFDILTTLCMGLLIGTEFAVSVFVNPILEELDLPARTEAVRLFARRLGKAMPFWYAGCLVLLLVQILRHNHRPGFVLLSAAAGLWVAVILLSVLWLVPINNRLIEMPDFDPTAQRAHKRWDRLHRLRVAALLAAMVLFLSGL